MHKARRAPVGSQSDLLEGTGLHVSLGSLRIAVGTTGQKEQTSPAFMLCLVIFAGHALGLAAAQKAVLTLDPPWSTVFKGESVTLSCSGSRSAGSTRTSWYLEGHSLKSTETNIFPIKAAELTDKGRYQCKTSNSTHSDTIQLTVSAGWLILQAPYYALFEGDRLVLRCCGWKDGEVYGMRYYRYGTAIIPRQVQANYTIEQAKTTDSGKYRCEGQVKSGLLYYASNSNEVLVLVQGKELLGVLGWAEMRQPQDAGQEGTDHGRGKDPLGWIPSGASSPTAVCPWVHCGATALTAAEPGQGGGETRSEALISSCPSRNLTVLQTETSKENAVDNNRTVTIAQSTRPEESPVGSQSDLLEGTDLWASLGRLRVAVSTTGQEDQPSRAPMLCLVIIAAHALGLAAAAQKAVLTLDPPWSTVFEGDSVTLTCSGSRFAGSTRTSWYFNSGEHVSESTQRNSVQIKAAQVKNTGKYQCETRGSTRSDPVQLTVSRGWLILQAPHYAVFEGDRLLLRCRGWRGGEVHGMKYYRNGAEITPRPVQSSYTIDQAKTTDGGRYQCKGEVIYGSVYYPRVSNEVLVLVRELFSTPELRVAGSAEMREGSSLALSCVTQPSPEKPDLRLQYSFYNNSTVVREPTSSPEYQVPEAGLADSGPYSHVVQAVTSSVQKRSPERDIEVKRVPVSGVTLGVQPRNGQVVAGEWLVLSCSVAAGTGPLAFSWHREGSGLALRTETLRSRRMDYEIPAAMESDAGEYYCAASNGHDPVLSPRVMVTVWAQIPSLSYCQAKGLILLGLLAVLVSGIIAVHVLTGRKQRRD
ncbi:uncharacterized protein LOC102569420 [Alligator mississippiensis]|uniref:uncharacterized protein LOC102569420 n=1 Tax=Alligator mississippiensis TaxID=8496 RepID=UPI002877B744|nr:uncharacterized protein LOC102569420 [Alligator mississippiensis]